MGTLRRAKDFCESKASGDGGHGGHEAWSVTALTVTGGGRGIENVELGVGEGGGVLITRGAEAANGSSSNRKEDEPSSSTEATEDWEYESNSGRGGK